MASLRYFEPKDFRIEIFRKYKVLLDAHLTTGYDGLPECAYVPWNKSFPIREKFEGLTYVSYSTSNYQTLEGYVSQVYAVNECSSQVLRYFPYFYFNKRFIPFWHGAVYQFGRKSLEVAKRQLEEACGTSSKNIFPIIGKIDGNILGQDVVFKICGFEYFKNKNEDIEIA